MKAKLNFKKAFTMAEAILVMTILGIIATIMITTLKPAEFKDKGLKVLAKKVLSEIDTATTQILVNNTKLGSMTTLVHANGTNFTWKGNASTVLSYYKKYLTTIRTTVPTTSFCVTGDAARSATAAYLKDGACIGIYASNVSSVPTRFPGESANVNATATQGLILFDTNGEEEPNIIGNDRFILPVGDGGIQYE
ncbi:MAG: type II secretion system protein [Candidatus Gastranaerophilales bacterium]|nr:type II secretion system protein [Candidatus Gastranaerophilales bacterium]